MDYAQRNLGAVQQSAKTALEGVGPEYSTRGAQGSIHRSSYPARKCDETGCAGRRNVMSKHIKSTTPKAQ